MMFGSIVNPDVAVGLQSCLARHLNQSTLQELLAQLKAKYCEKHLKLDLGSIE